MKEARAKQSHEELAASQASNRDGMQLYREVNPRANLAEDFFREMRRNEQERTNQSRQNRHQDFMIGCMCNIDSFYSDIVLEYSLGEFNLQCSFCGAYGFQPEKQRNSKRNTQHFGILCCSNGNLDLPHLPIVPDTMEDIFTGTTENSNYFLNNIRKFSSGMAMASFTYNDVTERRGAPGSFNIKDQVYRRIGPMLPPNDESHLKCNSTQRDTNSFIFLYLTL